MYTCSGWFSCMEVAELSAQAMLRETLRQLGFSEPTYTHELIQETHHQASVFFSTEAHNHSVQAHVYCIMGKVVDNLEKAEGDAANRALFHLEKQGIIELHDHSYTLTQKTGKQSFSAVSGAWHGGYYSCTA